jgi:hypothetical protein
VHRYGLYALQWIVEVNGQPTPDLESFIEVVKVCIVDTFGISESPFCNVGALGSHVISFELICLN